MATPTIANAQTTIDSVNIISFAWTANHSFVSDDATVTENILNNWIGTYLDILFKA